MSVPLQREVCHKLPATDSTECQLISHQLHGMLRGQPGHVVSNEGNAITSGIVSKGVGSLPVPASALIDVPIRTCDKTLEAQSFLDMEMYISHMQQTESLTAFTCILCRPSLCPPGGSAA